jgi:oligoendopeptidase F
MSLQGLPSALCEQQEGLLHMQNRSDTAIPERREIDGRYRWRLDRIFSDWDAWDTAFVEIKEALPGLAALRGSLNGGAEALLEAFRTIESVQRKLEVVAVYATMRSDEDTRIAANTARRGRAASLGTRFAEAVSWFDPELLTIEQEQIRSWLQACEPLRVYAHHIDNVRRQRPHTLDPDREELLAAAGGMTSSAGRIFSALTDVDMRFPSIRDEENRVVELTHARYGKFLRSADRGVRLRAYEAYLDTYQKVAHTLAATMDANVKSHVFGAESRRYESCLHASLHPDAVPVEVYHNLLAEVRANLGAVHRYAAFKRRVLGVDELHEFDLQVPLFRAAEFKFGYEEACDLLLAALAPLGDEYREIVRAGYREGWIDVHENLGKRSGAYSSGVYDTQPYILLNWSDQLSDTFTLAHELGHSVHSFLASRHQPFIYGDYPIFTAEVASTCNELLLLEHLLKETGDRERRLFLLDHHLMQIVGTVVRQAMFAEFELRIHEQGEARETLTAESMGDLYHDLLVDYWGPSVTLDPARSRRSWSRIPHFYYDFYVYQYATAYAAAAVFSRTILADVAGARERYLDILRSGCSRYPVETLAAGGVDMMSRAPFGEVFALFTRRLDEIERLLAEGDGR